MRMQVLVVALVAALGACARPMEVEAGDAGDGPYTVRLHNDGSVGLHNVRVTTGQDVPPLTIASLAPGATSGPAGVAVLHEHPIVAAAVNGRVAVFQPVEGFGGFNAQVAPGTYLIRLRYVPEYQVIDTRVERQP